jgi:hypothetical protein
MREDAAGIFSALSGIVEAIITGYENLSPLDRWIGVLEKMMRRYRKFSSDETEIQAAHAMFMALAFRQPQHPEIEKWSGRAFALAEGSSPLRLKIQTLYRLAVYRLAMGDMGKAWSAIHSLRQLTRSQEVSPYVKIEVKQVEAGYYRLEGSHESCLKAVSEALEISGNMGVHRLDQLLLSLGAQSALCVNDGPTAAQLLERKASSTDLSSPGIFVYHFPQNVKRLFQGDLGQASLHAEIALKFSKVWDRRSALCSAICWPGHAPIGKNRLLSSCPNFQPAAGWEQDR